ncbi:MAG: 16S rRNA (guanine(527)-N(7))-methyltransferase RsmG [Clostridia bacterium]|nr:16S rRNA (guanine(527)-N(7))-methyltransferase RsmG [Clostridia bacterium]
MRTELIGPELSPAQAEQFEKYCALLAEWNKVMNLTAIVDPDEVAVKHFADSLTLLPYLDRAGTRTLIDVGTGAGFPGIPLKIMRPELEVTLLDSLEKRVRFLDTVTCELGLSGIRTIHARAEDAGRDRKLRGQFDASVARAVAPMNVLCEYCLPFVRPDGKFFAMKGPAQEDFRRALKELGGEVEADDVFELTGAAGEGPALQRRIICVKKSGTTPAKYPRRAGLPAKKPLM